MIKKIILIGASTGGPKRIQKILSSFGKLEKTSVIIAQHMGRSFVPSFLKELNKNSLNPVVFPKNHSHIEVGKIYLCEENSTFKNSHFFVSKSNHFNPDINSIFNSFVDTRFQKMCVILTGIGNDGVDACYNLYKKDVMCITETKESAIVDGMPARAREKGVPAFSFDEIIKKIVEFSE